MELSEILRSRKRTENVGFVIPVLEEQVLKDAMSSRLKRRIDVFHPSDICNDEFCPREWLLYQEDPSLKKRKVSAQQQFIFDVGSEMHSYMQRKLGSARVLFGIWNCKKECNGDSCVHIGFKPNSEVCTKAIWEYKEPTVFDEELNIYGNTDGIFLPKTLDKKYTFEFKTMNTDAFSTLAEPVKRDLEQSFWYLDILTRKGFKEWNTFVELCSEEEQEQFKEERKIMELPYSGSVLVYMDKNDQRIREFFIPFPGEDKDLMESMDGKKALIKEALIHKDKKTLPDKLYQCDSKTARRARRCSAKTLCFNKG